MEVTDRDPSNLDRPEWNSLLNNYDAHDVGSEYVVSRLKKWSYYAEDWGIDMRNDRRGIIYDNNMDMKVRDPTDALCGIIDVKTKRSDSYYGVFNLRHFRHYQDIAEDHDCPTVVWMCRVDDDDTEVLYDNIIPITEETEPDDIWQAPDGNMVVDFDEDSMESVEWLQKQMEDEV